MNEDYRRTPRRQVERPVHVVDTMTDQAIGRLCNVSETGMLVSADVPLTDDALYQLRFDVDDPVHGAVPVQAGAHLLWTARTHVAGQAWAGFRFIAVPHAQMRALRLWLGGDVDATT